MTEAALLTARGLNVALAGRAVLRDISLSLSSGHLVAWSDRTAPARPRCCGRWRD